MGYVPQRTRLEADVPATVHEIVATGLFFPLALLLCGSAFVAPMWNRRAGMLRARRAAGFGA